MSPAQQSLYMAKSAGLNDLHQCMAQAVALQLAVSLYKLFNISFHPAAVWKTLPFQSVNEPSTSLQ
jgi:hypothetical protein